MIIRDKKQSYALYERGAFGNKLRTWNHIDLFEVDAYAFDVDNLVSVRYAGPAGGGATAYRTPVRNVGTVIANLVNTGHNRDLIRFNEAAPDEKLILQGELQRLPGGLALHYSRAKLGMRLALANAPEVPLFGLSAQMRVRRVMTPASYEDIQELFDTYPDAVIEFGCYGVNLGSCPRRNVVIWEVRNY